MKYIHLHRITNLKYSGLNLLFAIILAILFIPLTTVGQQKTILIQDTLVQPSETYKVADILIQLGESSSQARRLRESLITDDEIEELEQINQQLINQIDSLLKLDKSISTEAQSNRFLNNKLNFWNKSAKNLDAEISSLNVTYRNLSQKIELVIEDLNHWNKVKTFLSAADQDPNIISRIDEVMNTGDSLKQLGQNKGGRILKILDVTTEKSDVLDDYISIIDQIIVNKQGYFKSTNEPFYHAFDFADKSVWNLKRPFRNFYNMEVKAFITLIKSQVLTFIISLLFIILLIVTFRAFKKWIAKATINFDSIYQQRLKKVISRSVSASFIISLLVLAIFLSDAPELLTDILKLIIIVPLVLTSTTFLIKKFHSLVYLFGFLVVLITVSIVFPDDNIYYSLILITISLFEIFIFRRLAKYFYQYPKPKNNWYRFITFTMAILLTISVIGFLCILFGMLSFGKILIFLPITTVAGGILLITTAIILDGLVEILVMSPYFNKLNFIHVYRSVIKARTINVINLILFTLWIYAILRILNLDRVVIESIVGIFSYEIIIGSIVFTLSSVLVFFFVIWFSIVLAKLIHVILEQDVLNQITVEKGMGHTIATLAKYAIISIGVLLAISSTGIPLSSLAVVFGAFGVGIGFGLQNIFNNLVSGLILLFERPIKIGDTVEVGLLVGKVASIGLRSSNVRTFDGAEVIVPNGQFISNEVINWTLSDQSKRIEIFAGVAYGSDPHRVRTLLLQALNQHPDIIKSPQPNVFFNDLGESSLDFRLLFWTPNYDQGLRIRSEVVFLIHDALKEEGIEIPFPQQDLHIRSVDQSINWESLGNK